MKKIILLLLVLVITSCVEHKTRAVVIEKNYRESKVVTHYHRVNNITVPRPQRVPESFSVVTYSDSLRRTFNINVKKEVYHELSVGDTMIVTYFGIR